ncbi:cache domain-containing sensor histidine kinase [Paenibacillus kobensis]|uniref:cache domain-containing sensor histidine kinase n=1 Tax=Paenibacillus kobensis TaxID=59841 RepID=UPI000FDCAF89|nr:sensor histidine kinase [Paenibacillus kobensis]
MKRWKHNYLPFHYKLFLSYFFLVITPITVIGTYSYLTSVHTMENHTRNSLEVNMKQVNSNIQYRVDDIVRVSDEIFKDQLLSAYLSGKYVDWERYKITTQYVLPRLDTAIHLPKLSINLTLYLDQTDMPEYYYNNMETSLALNERHFEIRYTERISDEAWYKNLKLAYNDVVWRQVGQDAEFGFISMLRPLMDYDSLKPIGLIRLTTRLSDIFEDVDLNQLGAGSKMFAIDSKQQLLYANMPGTDKQDPTALLQDTKKYMQITKTINNMPVSLVALVPEASFKESSKKVRDVTILLCVISFVVLTLISLFVARMLSKRIMKLKLSLSAFKEGELHRRIHYSGKDEFAEIAESFNDMASTTQTLIDEVYISKLEKKETELQILHSQINPHFLYNTFSSISRMAKLGEIELLHEIIRELAKFYRLTLNKGEMLIPVEKELQIIEAYLSIQNMKSAGRIKTDIQIEDDLIGYETVKFILQPFVENALEHAWYDDEIAIHISVYRSGIYLIMEVNDNGLGMKQETIQQIFAPGPEAVGYGIRNVDQRIKLHYGKDYGVSITSEVGVGTSVKLTLPLIEHRRNMKQGQD